MDTSTYFDLNLVTGSDKVNPLTVDRPNYEKIDEQMHKNQIASIVEATELKSGTVHAITCLTENAVFFRFTATSDFAAGDTFTFNGTPVSAVLPDGSGLQPGAFKINGTVLCSIIGTLLTVYSFTASGIAADSEKLGGQLPAYYAKATDAISTYVHSRIGTVNNFVGTGANGKVKIVANIQAGDTIQINGQPVGAFAGADDFVSTVAGQELVGKTLFFMWDSTSGIVNFKLGGGGRVTVDGLTADVLLDGAKASVYQGNNLVSQIAGKLKPLCFGASAGGGYISYWNGVQYVRYVITTSARPLQLTGVPKIAYARRDTGGPFYICGKEIPAGTETYIYTENLSQEIRFTDPGNTFGTFMVLGAD